MARIEGMVAGVGQQLAVWLVRHGGGSVVLVGTLALAGGTGLQLAIQQGNVGQPAGATDTPTCLQQFYARYGTPVSPSLPEPCTHERARWVSPRALGTEAEPVLPATTEGTGCVVRIRLYMGRFHALTRP